MLKALDGRIAKFKMPKRVIFVDDLPRNTMGKVQKNVLRDSYKDIYAEVSPAPVPHGEEARSAVSNRRDACRGHPSETRVTARSLRMRTGRAAVPQITCSGASAQAEFRIHLDLDRRVLSAEVTLQARGDFHQIGVAGRA